jgi:hypothetical protein
LFAADMVPPCASITLLDINNPRPIPPISDFAAFEEFFIFRK